MTEPGTPRVAVYLDFDNIVISRYDQVNGRNSFQRDKAKGLDEHPERLERATVDVGAIIDFASSFGTLVLTRAYADWSADVNAELPRTVGRPRGRSGAAVPRRRVRQERRRHPAGGRRRRGHVPAARPHPRGDRGRRLRLHRARAAVQAAGPLRRRHRRRRVVEPRRWPRRATSSSPTTRCPAFRCSNRHRPPTTNLRRGSGRGGRRRPPRIPNRPTRRPRPPGC